MLLFALTIFTSAFLLFQVQPLIARFILPWFGGAPAVWTTCMLFFQIVLLLGYLYADLVTRWLRPRTQINLHSVLAGLALLLLPITPAEAWKPTGDESPTLRILLLLLAAIGLPYFLLSTTGPLVQAWFARTYPGRSPYRLFALSNLGSLLALLSYPLVFEPLLATRSQSAVWGYGFFGFVALVVATGWYSIGARGNSLLEPPSVDPSEQAELRMNSSGGPSFFSLNCWILLSTIPSVLLLATTNQICQEVAVVPFLWILPLSLYLISFIICFDKPHWYSRTLFGTLLIASSVSVIWCLVRYGGGELFMTLGSFLLMLFSACMTCHGELVRQRPAPQHLTIYYLMISIGGALGGMFVALWAPLLFKGFFELHWAMFAAAGASLLAMAFNGGSRELVRIAFLSSVALLIGSCFALLDEDNAKYFSRSFVWRNSCLAAFWILTAILLGWNDQWRAYQAARLGQPSSPAGPPLNVPWLIAIVLVLMVISSVFWLFPIVATELWRESSLVYFVILIAFASAFKVRFGIGKSWPQLVAGLFAVLATTAIGMLLYQHAHRPEPSLIEVRRDFYGLLKVKEGPSFARVAGEVEDEGMIRELVNGRTLHGTQFTRPDLRLRITSYYGEGSGVGLAISRHPKRVANERLHIGVVGLGVGTLAAWTRTIDKITFYEINPECVAIAETQFYFLSDSLGEKAVILGDARIQMERQVEELKAREQAARETGADFTPGLYDVLVIDAFSSDAIPRHLLTAESFHIYRQLVRPDGILAVHVSNQHLDLRPITLSLAEGEHWPARIVEDSPDENSRPGVWQTSSTWIPITDNQQFWQDPIVNDKAHPWDNRWRIHWTDDFGSLVQVLRAPKWLKQPAWWPWKDFWLKREK
ncbi:MAG: spermidine synthase [Planctomycetota bacterium]